MRKIWYIKNSYIEVENHKLGREGQANKIDCFSDIFLRKTQAGSSFFF